MEDLWTLVLSLPRIHPLAFHGGLCRVWCVETNRCIPCGYRRHPVWKRPQLLKSFTYPKTSPYFALHSFMHIRRVFVLRSSKLPNKRDDGGGPGMPCDERKFSFFFLSLQQTMVDIRCTFTLFHSFTSRCNPGSYDLACLNA